MSPLRLPPLAEWRHQRSHYELLDYDSCKCRSGGRCSGVLLIGFALTDGFDMGVGALLPFVAKTDVERRVVINTVGPVWEGNQVWFILGGGAIFAAWPPLYAVSFSGFYLAMFVVFWRHRSSGRSRSKTVSKRETPHGEHPGTGPCSPAARCPRFCSAWRLATSYWAFHSI